MTAIEAIDRSVQQDQIVRLPHDPQIIEYLTAICYTRTVGDTEYEFVGPDERPWRVHVARCRFAPHARVEGGDTSDDYEQGEVLEVRGDRVRVAWDQGIVTVEDASRLRPAGERPPTEEAVARKPIVIREVASS